MYCVLHIPDFPLQAVLRTENAAATEPAALFTDTSKKSVVVAANPAARAAGVDLGMSAPQAVARCPRLLIRTPKPAAEADARAALLAVGLTVSPAIEDTAPGVCTIDLKGTSPAHHERAAAHGVAQLQALGFRASAGLAATPLLALYAARSAPTGDAPSSSRLPAKRDEDGASPTSVQIDLPLDDCARAGSPDAAALVESRLGPADSGKCRAGSPHPAGSTALSPILAGYGAPARQSSQRTLAVAEAPGGYGPPVLTVRDAPAFLAPLPLAVAEPSAAVAGVLANWGIRTLGQLTALARDDVGRRLGADGLAIWDRARGGSQRPLRPVPPPQTFVAAMDFEEEVQTLEPLLFILRRFLERLTLELRTNGFVAAELELTLTLADDSTHERGFRVPDPTADVEILFRALHKHLESLRTEAGITGLALRALPARPLVRQHGLFDTGLRDPHGFSETLARITAIVGSERVGTPAPQDTHRPDATKLDPPAPVIPPASEPPVHPPTGLPLRRFRPPLRSQLELTEGRPTYLWTERFNGAVAEVYGPWLSSGEWWQADRAWRRAEYDVALENGGLYRLVFAEGGWMIEGEYD